MVDSGVQTVIDKTVQQHLDRFATQTGKFLAGQLSAVEYRVFRVPCGIYEQRQDGTYMIRLRCPAGCLTPEQLLCAARVSRSRGSGRLHLTTRQDLQIHDVLVEDLHPALVELAHSGLSAMGGGGNTVRNVSACHLAGGCPTELLDVTPHAIAVTEFMLQQPGSFSLPRKYKITLSGCSRDCAGARFNDLGLVAVNRDGERGFRVWVGGGMGGSSSLSVVLHEFVPEDEICIVAEAVKRVFDEHGNRRNKHKARLRFLLAEMGHDGFLKIYEECRQQVAASFCPPKLEETPAPNPIGETVEIPLFLGDIDAGAAEELAAVAQEFAAGGLRLSQEQNLLFKSVSKGRIGQLQAALRPLGIGLGEERTVDRMVACAGASTCRLGMCLSRGLAEAVRTQLQERGPALLNELDLGINISGCPNSCGRHLVADIGLSGAARRVGGQLVPYYRLQLGGKTGEREAAFAQGDWMVPARQVPGAVADICQAYLKSGETSFAGYCAGATETVSEIVHRYSTVPSIKEQPEMYFDWGAESQFSLEGRGPGECGAGVFDLIELDLASSAAALEAGDARGATVLACRALLVTRGLESKSDQQSMLLFVEHFLGAGLLGDGFREHIESALRPGPLADNALVFAGRLLQAVRGLYDGMDQSLRFKPELSATNAEAGGEGDPAEPRQDVQAVDQEVDFRGVVCPLNFVKTKMVLDTMASGQVLQVLLDDNGVKNVPDSVRGQGHEVLTEEAVDAAWRVVIRKK